MSRFVLRGGERLSGELTAQGAKNSVLPILAATILSRGVCVLHRCPRLRDVEVSLEILRYIGASAEREGDSLRVDASGVCRCAVPDALMREMRYLDKLVDELAKGKAMEAVLRQNAR